MNDNDVQQIFDKIVIALFFYLFQILIAMNLTHNNIHKGITVKLCRIIQFFRLFSSFYSISIRIIQKRFFGISKLWNI